MKTLYFFGSWLDKILLPINSNVYGYLNILTNRLAKGVLYRVQYEV